MTENRKFEIFIRDLINFTSENKIRWHYTNGNRDMAIMAYKIHTQKVPFYDGYSTTDNCFYTQISGGYIIIIERSRAASLSKYYLAVVPDLGAKTVEVYDSPQSQPKMIQLHSLILRTSSKVGEYLTDVFNALRTKK